MRDGPGICAKCGCNHWPFCEYFRNCEFIGYLCNDCYTPEDLRELVGDYESTR